MESHDEEFTSNMAYATTIRELKNENSRLRAALACALGQDKPRESDIDNSNDREIERLLVEVDRLKLELAAESASHGQVYRDLQEMYEEVRKTCGILRDELSDAREIAREFWEYTSGSCDSSYVSGVAEMYPWLEEKT